jgi:hypothetical protein
MHWAIRASPAAASALPGFADAVAGPDVQSSIDKNMIAPRALLPVTIATVLLGLFRGRLTCLSLNS